MTPAALQSKSSTLGPRARGDELGLTAVAFSLFICFHLHLGFAFRPSEHLLAQAVHEVARARRAVRIQRVLLVLARGRCPESSSNARAHGCGIIWSLLARIHRSGTVRGIFASLPERPRRSPSGFSSLASTRPAMNRFCQRSNVALVEIARQPDRQIVLVFDTSYQRQNLRLDQTRKDENPFLCETCHKRKNVRSNPGNFAANAGP